MICKILFLSYRAALAARTPRSHTWQLQQPVGVLTAFLVPDSHKTGHGNLRCTARASAPSGACQAWAVAACLLVRGGSGQRSYLTRAAAGSQQPARQVQRQQHACTSGGGGGPGCPVNATAGCNLCTGAKGTYHPPRYMKRKKMSVPHDRGTPSCCV